MLLYLSTRWIRGNTGGSSRNLWKGRHIMFKMNIFLGSAKKNVPRIVDSCWGPSFCSWCYLCPAVMKGSSLRLYMYQEMLWTTISDACMSCVSTKSQRFLSSCNFSHCILYLFCVQPSSLWSSSLFLVVMLRGKGYEMAACIHFIMNRPESVVWSKVCARISITIKFWHVRYCAMCFKCLSYF